MKTPPRDDDAPVTSAREVSRPVPMQAPPTNFGEQIAALREAVAAEFEVAGFPKSARRLRGG